MTIAALRTPEGRFAAPPGWTHPPRYLEDLRGYVGLRAHYVDEGPRDAPHTFLCLHGEPSWSYLYRRMAPVFLASGARVVAPDLYGFGRSDKPIDDAIYTTDFHRNYLIRFVERLDLTGITLVIQDWVGLLGLTLPLAIGERIERLIIMNTMFGDGAELSPGFLAWRAYAAKSPDMPVGALIGRGAPHMTPAEIATYDAPFPDMRFKAGVRRFPQLVPSHPDDPFAILSRAAADWWSTRWTGPTFAAVGMADPVLGPEIMRRTLAHIAGAPAPMEIEGGGHFVQEWGERIATAALAHFGDAR
jgi:pimeloyl-ACP methyl ester carboxylesterase